MSDPSPSPTQPVIQATDLVKRYGDFTAVAGIDLAVLPGEIFGILGPNGAGKTTTLEMIEGLRTPDSGTIRVAGYDAVAQSEEVRRVIGVQLQTTALFDYLTAAELIELYAGLYEVDDSPERVDALLQMVGLEEKRNARANELSGGQQQRLSIALALVNDPRIVFLDEPTTGLDPQARRALWSTIRDVRAGGATVVLTTHYMEEAEVLCDRVAIMDRGRIIACDTPTQLIRQLGPLARIRTVLRRGLLDLPALQALPGVSAATLDGDQVELHTAHAQETLLALLEVATANGVELADLRTMAASLEDVFLTVAGRTYEQPEERPAETGGRRRRRRGGA